MCGEPDYCYTTMESNAHKARKEHECCACDDIIRPGDRYVKSFLIGDNGGPPEHYKHCLRCWKMLEAIRAQRRGDAICWELDCGEDWLDSIGELPDDVERLAFMTADEAQQQLAAVKP